MIFDEPILFQRGIKLEATIAEAQIIVSLVDGTKLLQVDQNGLLTMDGIVPASIHYNNTVSGLLATTVQGAIDELANVGGPPPTSFVFGGNAFGFDAALGTTDAHDLIFVTNNTEQARITSAGLFGVGVPSPVSKLHVNGDFILAGMAAPALSPAGEGRIYFDSILNRFQVSENGGSYFALSGDQFLEGGNAFGALAVLGTTDNFALSVETNGTERIRIDTSGNLGLGTSTFGTSAAKVFQIFTGTTPSTAPADSVALYSKDFTTGDARLYVRSELGNPVSIGNGAFVSDQIFIGADSVSFTGVHFDFSETRAFDDASYYTAWSSQITADPSVNLATNGFAGHNLTTRVKATSNKNVLKMSGLDFFTAHLGSGTVTNQYGILLSSSVSGSGGITNNRGISLVAASSGTSSITSNTGMELNTGANAGTSITSDYTLRILSPLHAGTLTTHYGIYLADQAFGGTSYALYSAGGQSFFAGNVGIGVPVPAQALDLIGGITWRGVSPPPVSFGSEGRVYFDSSAAVFKVSENGQAYYNLVTERTGFIQGGNTFGTDAILGTKDGFNLFFQTNNLQNWRMETSGTFRSDVANPDPRIGINIVPSSALDVHGAVTVRALLAPAVAPSSSARVYYDFGLQRLQISENGGSYINFPRPTELWGSTGNAGTDPSTNFLGTTDDVDFVIKRFDIPVERIYAGGATVWTGTGAGPVPVSGSGTRMVWTPIRSALRAGSVTGAEWDDGNTGVYSFAAGYNTQASGSASVSLGKNSTASGVDSFVSGEDAQALMLGQFSRSSGGFGAVKGSAQMSFLVGSAETTDNTQTEMSLSPAVSSFVVLENNAIYAVNGTVVAKNTANIAECSMWNIKFVCSRGAGAGTTTVLGLSVTPVYEALVGTWLVTVVADVVNGRFAVKVTGENGKTLRWVSNLNMTEVKG